jgi:inosine-uridine nucleoside N-ribohydrolase
VTYLEVNNIVIHRYNVKAMTSNKRRRRKKVIMDVDTGIDDAIAIIVALQSPDIQIIGITSVNGNVSSRTAALNTLRILQAMGRQYVNKIPVIQGASRPLYKKLVRAKDVHGDMGLGDVQLECDDSLLRHGNISQFISETLRNYRKGEISLIATGPLTNVASAITADPSIVDSLSKICIMGGAYGLASKDLYGNITQYAEFNFYCDPVAAQIVMDSRARMNIVGLDTTNRYLIDDMFIARLQSKNNEASKIARSLLQYPMRRFGRFDLPDLFAVTMFERPDIFEFKRGRIEVMQEGQLRGHSRLIEAKRSSNSRTLVVSGILNEKYFDDYVFSRLGSNTRRRPYQK